MKSLSDTRKKAIARLEKMLELAGTMRNQRKTPAFTKWWRDIAVAIEKIFGKDSDQVKEFRGINLLPRAVVAGGGYDSRAQYDRAFESGFVQATALMGSILDEIETYGFDEIGDASSEGYDFDKDKVFIVHGRDVGAREEVARIMEKLEIAPIILADQASVGNTIIEKFEKHTRVGFAIVLLTPDDEGKLKQDDDVRSRARQNVIFEFGFFIGKLGRKRVCALTKGRVEIPSDYSGVLYIKMSQENWKLELVKELQAAGYVADANKLT